MKLPVRIVALILLASILGAGSLRAEVVTLTAIGDSSGDPVYSDSVTVAQGDVAQILYSFPANVQTAEVTIGGRAFNIGAFVQGSAGTGGGLPTPALASVSIAGPATIRARATGSTAALVTVSVTRANAAPTIAPQNAVVIPADAAGPVQIILEASADLVNWVAATPGTYGASTTQRFFRVRAIQQ